MSISRSPAYGDQQALRIFVIGIALWAAALVALAASGATV